MDRYYRDEIDPEAFLHPREGIWAVSSIFLAMLQAYEETVAIPIRIDLLPELGFQAALMKALRDLNASPWPEIIRRRPGRWLHFVTA
jgi:hypothetical protein